MTRAVEIAVLLSLVAAAILFFGKEAANCEARGGQYLKDWSGYHCYRAARLDR